MGCVEVFADPQAHQEAGALATYAGRYVGRQVYQAHLWCGLTPISKIGTLLCAEVDRISGSKVPIFYSTDP